MARIETDTTISGPGRMAPGRWIGDYLNREHLVPGGARLDPAQFEDSEAVRVGVTAAAAAGATALTVTALSAKVPAGTVLDFGGDEFARTTADANAGATTIAVAALPQALEGGEAAYYRPRGMRKHIPSGTLVGRTYAERDADTPFGPAADADDEVYLLAFDLTDAAYDADGDLYRPGSIVKENLLTSFAGLSATLKGKVRTLYQCVRGGI